MVRTGLNQTTLAAAKRRRNLALGLTLGLLFCAMCPEGAPDLVRTVIIKPQASIRPRLSGATREAVLQKCLVRIAPRDREVGDAFRAHSL
jgi:hypothetical protein